MYHGGGLALMREFYKDYNMISFPAGNTGAQMGGWFRKEIKTVADLKGLKFRIGGTGALPLAKLGVVPQQIAGGDIYPALEKGTIDAAEWVGPYDDEKLGFYKIAKNYYYPGWWEGSTGVDCYVNIKAWEALPKDYQAIFEAACYEANMDMTAKYDSLNPAAMKRLIGNGVQLQPFSNEILAACYKATTETYDEIAAKNAKFKKIYEPWKAFREEQISGSASQRITSTTSWSQPRRLHRRIKDAGRATEFQQCTPRKRRFLSLSTFPERGADRAPLPATLPRRSSFGSGASFGAVPYGWVSVPGVLRSAARRSGSCSCRPWTPSPCRPSPSAESDHEPDHDHLDKHEGHRAPIDLARRNARRELCVILSMKSFAGATLRK